MVSAHPTRHRARRRWRLSWAQVIACLVILAGACVFLYPHVASWFSQLEQSRVTELAQEAMEEPPNDDAQYLAGLLEEARAYNDALASGAIYHANDNVATGDGQSSNDSFVYADMLSITEAGIMGRLQYDQLSIDLPVYHGTSVETLEKGIGHLEGTSLPVGGLDTRSVLTAHRGLPTSTLFNDLDKAKVGDTFTVSVLDQILTYQVVEIKVIEPSQTEEIFADRDRDLVTLITCTPLGVNSHRILVTGERVTPTPIEDIAAAVTKPEIPGFPWWTIILGSIVILVVGYAWWAGYAPPVARSPRRDDDESATV